MEENTAEIIESPEEETKLKTCFVITPIGDENSSIRRHIDGVINAAIRPALKSKYKINVAHEFTTTGSINKQVIVEIYDSDLVIANLTDLNPNVMYELAIRHALKKPVIMIMEKGDNKLPFDVANERTIFYKNDFQGVLDLKKEIERTEENMESIKNLSNPIYDALYEYTNDKSLINLAEKEGLEDVNVLKSILNKISNLEKTIYKNNLEVAATEEMTTKVFNIRLEFKDEVIEDEKIEIIANIRHNLRVRLVQKFGVGILFLKKAMEGCIAMRVTFRSEGLIDTSSLIDNISKSARSIINQYDSRVGCEYIEVEN